MSETVIAVLAALVGVGVGWWGGRATRPRQEHAFPARYIHGGEVLR